MGDKPHDKAQEAKQGAKARQVGSGDAPTNIKTKARHIGPRSHDVRLYGGTFGKTKPADANVLTLDLFRPFSNDASTWMVRIHERAPDGSLTLLATFSGKTGGFVRNVAQLTSWDAKVRDVPDGFRVMLPVRLGNNFAVDGKPHGVSDAAVTEKVDGDWIYHVPLKGHQDYANESWDILVHAHVDDGLVHDDDNEVVHAWIDWPVGTLVYPMLGAPCIVKASGDKWAELLLATKAPLPKGAESFFVRSQTRIYEWGDAHRQDALKKRTFELYKPDEIQIAPYTFADVGTDVKAEKSDGFATKLGLMNHWCAAEQEERLEVRGPDGAPTDPGEGWQKKIAVTVPGVVDGVHASDVPLYKVRIKLTKASADTLYNLVWMNGDDLALAQRVTKDDLKIPISLLQDQALRSAIMELYGGRKVKDGSYVSGDKLIDQRVQFELDGVPQDSADEWKPTLNRQDPKKPDETKRVRLYHPVYVSSKDKLKVGHLTDIHLDTRLDVMAQNPFQLIPPAAGALATQPLGELVNNYNATFVHLAHRAVGANGVDALVLTGDLTDYGRGFALPPPAKVDEKYVWMVGASGSFPNYRAARNWVFFYQIMLHLYDKLKKPVLTLLGNHDYRPNPYGVYPGIRTWSPYASIGGDLNLTVYEVAAVYGPAYNGLDVVQGSLLETSPTAVHWYSLAINGWRDFATVFGDQTLLLMDWDREEDNIETGGALDKWASDGSTHFFHLPRAARFMTWAQTGIYERWRASSPATKVLCTHCTLVCNNIQVRVSNLRGRSDPPVNIGQLRHGTMGKSSGGGGHDTDYSKALRSKVAKDLKDGTVKLAISGHSHMDGVYTIVDANPGFWDKHWGVYSPYAAKMKYPLPPWHGGTTSADVTSCAVVTNSSGPLGEWRENHWTRRSPPSGNAFSFNGSQIHMEQIVSKRAFGKPRRCVHDCERARVHEGAFKVHKFGVPSYDNRGWSDAEMASKIPGYFHYLLDPDDTSEANNSVLTISLVICDGSGKWRSETSPLQKLAGDLMQVKDPNSNEKVTASAYGFSFTKQLIYDSISDLGSGVAPSKPPFEVYMVLKYNQDSRDDWVIGVSGMLFTARRNGQDEIGAIWQDNTLPTFDGRGPRWATK